MMDIQIAEHPEYPTAAERAQVPVAELAGFFSCAFQGTKAQGIPPHLG